MTNIDQNSKSSSKIIGIQFSILSPEEIRKSSVAEITTRDTYINNKPVISGLFDPRMGILDPGLICPTDGLDYMKTPGYFGHINLSRPVFYIQYLNIIIKVLRCTCTKCSKLLINKERYKYLLELSNEQRWAEVFAIASKVKRCGENNDDGCGYKQPKRIFKENLATIIADWDSVDNQSLDGNTNISMKLTPEKVIKIFRRISDDDIKFMGFSPIWSRPEWMICQALAVPPPAVRPSVKHDSQQRSEDDLTHIIVNIIKANKSLQEKINQNASSNVIEDWTTVLQYYTATLVDNKIPGVASVAQRSGRPLKSIKERLNGKSGRVRGNLMGKRVDFSARSVITPDPQLSIKDLGVPMKIAKNLTKPEIVNKNNMNFLLKLVRNGPDKHPGAKILEKKNGDSISLRYVDRDSIKLQIGDIVHRHMMDGDPILFNRQPTLHRMSMMSHISKILHVGDTFRMNVGDTKPYNADFDGDEMNLHLPQNAEAETELAQLAAIPTQIISPANNKSIIGIFQDSLLGCYTFTEKEIKYSPRTAMNLLMAVRNIDVSKINRNEVTNFEMLSQIIPPLSLQYKTKKFREEDDFKTSNNVLQIENGKYVRGQMEKGVLGDGSKGLIQRIFNDYGPYASADFIDNLQSIITDYMKINAYSVGISDLIADNKTNTAIADIISEKKKSVNNLIDETHLGIFVNKTGKTNEQEFETQVNNILNKASLEAGKIGRSSLSKYNRFVIMVNAGSKGSELNIAQMISCLGQQNVDGKRIPYGFTNRTLPHFSKFDDSPNARGFIESSFISGLSPTELFFHAMGGRVGLIDTAVKTSQTGYISRRLIKSLEDCMVNYDMTVRNNKNKIIQYHYGDDNFDPVRVESQSIPFIEMTNEDIYNYYQISLNEKDSVISSVFTQSAKKKYKTEKSEVAIKNKYYIDLVIQKRKEIVDNIYKKISNKQIHLPVAFNHIIKNTSGNFELNINSLVDISILEAYKMIENTFNNLNKYTYIYPNELFRVLYFYYLCPKELLIVKRFNKKALTYLLDKVVLTYKQAIINPGEMVGIVAAQSIGEPTTQMTLNTFHFAGVSSKSNVTRGVPRIEEILSLSENPKNPSCTVALPKDIRENQEEARKVIHKLEHTKLYDIVKSISVCFDPDDLNTLVEEDEILIKQYKKFSEVLEECLENTLQDDKEKSKWIIRMELNEIEMLDKNITMEDVYFALKNSYPEVNCIYSDYNSDKLIFRIRLNKNSQSKKKETNLAKSLDQADEIYIVKNFQDELLNNLVLRGIKKISNVLLRKVNDFMIENESYYDKKDIWVLDTVGTNLITLLSLDYIDVDNTTTNDIQEIYNVLGIEAARQAIYNELTEVIEFDSTYINYHHLSLLCDRMTCSNKMISVFRHGINNDNIGPIAKASFEETPEQFLKAARHAELDNLRGVSANVMCGQNGYFGTGAFKVMLDVNNITKNRETEELVQEDNDKFIQEQFGDLLNEDDPCSINNISIQTNLENIKEKDLGKDDDYDPFA